MPTVLPAARFSVPPLVKVVRPLNVVAPNTLMVPLLLMLLEPRTCWCRACSKCRVGKVIGLGASHGNGSDDDRASIVNQTGVAAA